MAALPANSNFHILIEELSGAGLGEEWPTTKESYQNLPKNRDSCCYRWQQGHLTLMKGPQAIRGELIESATIGYRGPEDGLFTVAFDIRKADIAEGRSTSPDPQSHGFSFDCAKFTESAPVWFNVGMKGNRDHIPPAKMQLPSWAALFPNIYQPRADGNSQLRALGGLHGRLTVILALIALYGAGQKITLHDDYVWPTWKRPKNPNTKPNRIVVVSIYSSRKTEDLAILTKIMKGSCGPIVSES